MKGKLGEALALTSRETRHQIGMAIALITVIPVLAAAYLAWVEAGSVAEVLARRPFVVLLVVLVMLSGYALIATYPANIARLRRYLEKLVDGEAPDKVTLLRSMADIPAIERALNLLVEQMNRRVSTMERNCAASSGC